MTPLFPVPSDPFLYFDRNGYFHVIAHCYTCYWWPSTGFTLDGRCGLGQRPDCNPGAPTATLAPRLGRCFPSDVGSPSAPGSRGPRRQRGDCSPLSAHCSGHGYSRTGQADNWTWIGGEDAPYNFTEADAAGGTTAFSTRERPWGLMGGTHGDQVLALINGVSPPFPQLKFVAGRDWCYTNIQGVDK